MFFEEYRFLLKLLISLHPAREVPPVETLIGMTRRPISS